MRERPELFPLSQSPATHNAAVCVFRVRDGVFDFSIVAIDIDLLASGNDGSCFRC